MDNCGGQSYDGAVNMAGRYAEALTLIQNQFAKIILFLDKFILVETSHTNSWIHPCQERFKMLFTVWKYLHWFWRYLNLENA